ncbi:probable fucosyltransferase 7 [Abrus precatorius]|uniref:Fucosyltransferase n=1 Tax=Abrus precatorius TaxID=3816 RepID=A0A8B8KLY1_ABRPR|nr:probable fucosyltransferase 7 [Abrus precatorius]
MDQTGLNSMRLRMLFVMFFIVFPVVIIVTLMYRNSSFELFESFSKDKLQEESGTTQNVTTNGFGLFGGTVQNTTHESLGGKKQNNDYHVSSSKNASLTSSTNDSTPQTVIPDDKVTDKLLDGLLASGFDETSCLSRVQSHLYHKASPHKPSPYLISKLRNYEEIHRKCGPYGRAYDRSMIEIVRSKNSGVKEMCKYIIWTPVNGLGNQMISMAATFLYAVLTDRVLLVKFGKDKHGLFCEPFINSTWILPEKSHFRNEKHIEKYQIMLEKDSANNSKEHLPSTLFINLQHTRSDPEKLFHCDHSQDLLHKVPLLILRSDQYFVPSLFMNPFFNQEITKIFPEKDTVFHHLGRYLFHPSNDAWKLISNFYEAHLAEANERVGIQIRVFNPVSTPQQTVMDLVLNCTMKHKLLPEVSSQTSSPSTGKNKTVKAVLVASLYPEYGENLRTMYLEKPTVTGEIVQVYQPSHEEHQKFNDNKHNMKAWVDMYLLSLSDVLVTTSLSTFGYVAQGLGHLKPWLLYKLVNNKTHFPSCERDFSMDPCYHTPPKHYCNGKPIKDYVSSFLYLRKCKDYHFGVKLVNGSM